MVETVDLGEMSAVIVRKDIKNIHLCVYPPDGKVRISAPYHTDIDAIKVFALTKLGWIRQQRRRLVGQERETSREYLDRESHYVWGKRFLLKIAETEGPSNVELNGKTMFLHIRPGMNKDEMHAALAEWYRKQLRKVLPEMIERWESLMGVKVTQVFIQGMKTKWGSCNPSTGMIRLNLELAKKPIECLEYILVHEMAHLIEPTHNQNFVAVMDRFMPNWQFQRDNLNRLPVRHESWKY